MARHRSPHGRRALPHPLLAGVAATVGGAHRSTPDHPWSTAWLPTRFVAIAIAGSAAAAVGQQALVQATTGTSPLSTAVNDLFAPAAAATAATTTVAPPVTAVAAFQPVVANATGLVKAADVQAAAAAKTAQDARTAQQGTEKAQADQKAAQDAENARKAAAAAPVAAKPVAKPVAKPAAKPAAHAAPAKPAAPAAANAVGAHAAEIVTGRLSSGFGQRGSEFHQGQDIAAPIGTPIHAPLAGTVIDAGPASGFGLWVRIRHADGTITTYGHVNKFFVKVGQKVAAGEVIAEVGNRGHSTGPHLHFEVTTQAGRKINPLPWLNGLGIRP